MKSSTTSETSLPHSQRLSDADYYALVNAVTSRFDCDRVGRGIVDREGMRSEFDRVLSGLFEQYGELQEYADELERERDTWKERAEAASVDEAHDRAERLQEQLEAAQRRIHDLDELETIASRNLGKVEVERDRLKEQLEAARQALERGRYRVEMELTGRVRHAIADEMAAALRATSNPAKEREDSNHGG